MLVALVIIAMNLNCEETEVYVKRQKYMETPTFNHCMTQHIFLPAHNFMDTARYTLLQVTILFAEEQAIQQVKFAGFGDKLNFQSCVTNNLL